MAAEFPQHRDSIQQMSDRVTAEIPLQSEARLQQMRDRVNAENSQEREREARVQDMSTRQHE